MSGGRRSLLLEIGCEEIPDRMLDGARADLGAAVLKAIGACRLLGEPGGTGAPCSETFATPRRLAVRIEGVLDRQPDAADEVTGPPVSAAFDPGGAPTRAAIGFAAGQGVAVTELYRVQGAKGEVVAARRHTPGRAALEVLAPALAEAVLSLSFPKAMRWGVGGHHFVRPIRWVAALLGTEVIPVTLAGVVAGRRTAARRGSGHPAPELADPATYEDVLRQVEVIADPEERRRLVLERLAAAAAREGGALVRDDELTGVVVNLVEYPGCLTGKLPAPSLELPREILTTTLRHHQRCFSIAARDGTLLPRFVAVINLPEKTAGQVCVGYERVIAGRLADARFFHDEDRRRSLESRLEELAGVRFHPELGSYAEKVERLVILTGRLADLAGASREVREGAVRAARLSKCDLVTLMENEFPELQGIIGGLYAGADGEPPAVGRAIYDQYLPAGLDDPLPRDAEGALLALADRLDTLVGLMGVGVAPKGSSDPYALRRAALGIVRILAERPLKVSVRGALAAAWETLGGRIGTAWKVQGDDLVSQAARFLEGRLRYLFEERGGGHRYDSITAVLAAGWDDPADASARLAALSGVRGQADFEALATASKRIRNILAQAGVMADGLGSVDEQRLVEAAERELYRAASAASVRVLEATRAGDHSGALRHIAALRPQVDSFFDRVLVMDSDAEVRRNRLALLASISRLYAGEADFAEIVVEGTP